MKIKQITRDEAVRLIKSSKCDIRYEHDYEPRGLFWIEGKTSYIAIDNHSGDAFVEEFKTKRACFRYLRGKPTRNADGIRVG
jgi:hypothetical protein